MKVECEIRNLTWHFCHEKAVDHSTCFIDNKTLPKNEEQIELKKSNQNENFTGLKITNSLLLYIPNSFHEVFKHIDVLSISNCGLNKISNEILNYFPRLDFLDLSHNELEFLPENLFYGFKYLKYINISFNKLTMINPNIVNSLHKEIWYLDLSCNSRFNIIYSFTNENRTGKKKELKNLLNSVEYPKEKCINDEIFSKVLENLKPFLTDIENYLDNDDFKDFTIILDDESKTKIHKMIFIARSSVFAQIIKNNPDAEELKLKDIPKEIFKDVLKFVYTDIIPNGKEKFIEIYTVAEKLGIKSLTNGLKSEAMKLINEENAFDFLALAIKHKIEDLKEKSIQKIQKVFPDIKLKSDLESQCDQFRKIAETRRALKKMMEEISIVE